MLDLQFTPFPVLQTQRLVLRAIEATDIDALYDMRNIDDAMYYLHKERQTREEIAQMISRIQGDHQDNNAITWVISRPHNTALIGTLGFWRVDKTHHRAEIGYMLHPDHWRKGYLNEALAAALQYGFGQMKLHSVEGHVNPLNIASVGLLEKNGFEREALFRGNCRFRGEYYDTAVYCRINEK
jgi:ribosomal-protein-alanine N-acetyltransferase